MSNIERSRQIAVTRDVDHPASAIWSVLSAFDDLACNPFVQQCSVDGQGRELRRIVTTPDGTRIVEKLTELDSAARVLRYTIMASEPARPFVGRMITIQVDVVNTGTRILWSAVPGLEEVLDENAIKQGFNARLDALIHAVTTGSEQS